MASGKSIELQHEAQVFRNMRFWAPLPEREKRERDRSLRGKTRRNARKAARREQH